MKGKLENALVDLEGLEIKLNDLELKNNAQVENAPVVIIVDYLLNKGVENRASDIHIEPFEKLSIVRLRIDGVLTELMELPKEAHAMVATRIKIISRLDTAERRLPQDGKLQFKINEIIYDLRVSIVPTFFGEKIVIRILYKNEAGFALDNLGLSESCVNLIKESLHYSSGMVLITGPTGSGKSTTLYSMLNQFNKKDKNIITIEDPVECLLFRVNQININNRIGLSFASTLRSILRQDPDIIMLGEVRDKETAEIAIRASITGHQVLSTLHTRDSVGSITRLMDLGISRYLIADSLICVMAQRLLRRLCPYCKVEEFNQRRTYKSKGCDRCNFTGYIGRIPVFEMLKLDSYHKKLLIEGNSIEEIRKYSYSKMTTLEQEGRKLLEKGETSHEEYLNLIYD